MTTSHDAERPPARWRAVLDALVAIAMLVAACSIIWVNLLKPDQKRAAPRVPALPTALVSLEGAAIRGEPTARAAIIEYSDFQCPFCGRFARETLPRLEEGYVKPGKVLLAFRHLPLTTLHQYAFKAAEAAECAHRTGKFWEMHDALFRDQRGLDAAGLRQKGLSAGIDAIQFERCLGGEAAATIQRDQKEAEQLGITSTPVFLVGTLEPGNRVKVVKVLSGARNVADFSSVLDKIVGGRP
ncbi:MAG: hypothetical protein A3H96_21405 [Acidobacteria bacterium RIFCSPLOWO2_02_FULL_67_36]|nr:MAG: hypothetical protein A3H96_21405 [Acidobacteria bacterium RIFCSPLOWO2_02_FULL_67_36]OFW21152.1 MAG: hypothetical protein A3G21_11000 [Acidobacteria bacterium RIFCSPLOWO2_12_FULL_66_21]